VNFRHGVTITVKRGGTDSRTGDPLPTTEHTVERCGVAPRSSAETNNLGNAVITGLTVFAPYGADIRATDTVLIPGDPDAWYVEGEAGHWRNPFTGWQAGTQFALTRQKG
jgi:hypothetical protein